MVAGVGHSAAGEDLLLGDSDVDRARELLDGLHKMLGKSRLLRWSLRDLAPLTAESLDRHELPAALAGDTYDRLLTRVGLARTLLREPLSSSLFELESTKISDALPALVRGLDVATARLVVASLGIDTARANESILMGDPTVTTVPGVWALGAAGCSEHSASMRPPSMVC